MTVSIKTYQQILGEMIRTVLPNTPLNDINVGSVLLTLLEAAASSDFDNSASILSILELLNIDNVNNSDLDNRAADYGLTRFTAQTASGLVTITDTSFTKRSTSLYSVKLPPIAGSTVIYANNAADWAPTGSFYIGRGTASFEGPISYTSIEDHTSFYKIILSSTLKKDHLISDAVVDAQNTQDRRVIAGTTVFIPANSQNPNINYSILREIRIPAGETTAIGVPIVAQLPGTMGNASIGTIVQFSSVPFAGATVTNTSALTDGKDQEQDLELRERIKAHTSTLARGTRDAILQAIIGLASSEDGKQVQSAVVKEPASAGEPSIIYVDDGHGFQPDYSGQSVDVLLASAVGSEEFLQLANFPLPRPQVVNTVEGHLTLTDGMMFVVQIDGVEEAVEFSASEFRNIATATLVELVVAINKATTFKCRLTDDSTHLLLYPVAHDAESLQVISIRSTDDATLWANNVLAFPTTISRYISLYHNNRLLTEKMMSASLTTAPYSSWGISTTSIVENLSIEVDGTPIQDRNFTASDFGGVPIAFATSAQWAAAFNKKFAGLVTAVTLSNSLQLSSSRLGTESILNIVGGSLSEGMFGSVATSDVGQNAEFELNRQTGNLRVLVPIVAGDNVTAGSIDAKGSIISNTSAIGTFVTQPDLYGRAANTVVVVDSSEETTNGVSLAVGTQIIVSSPAANIMRLMSNSVNTFASVQPHDYIYIAERTTGWLSSVNCGTFAVLHKGGHTAVGTDSYIDLYNPLVSGETKLVQAVTDIQSWRANTYPQVWHGTDATVTGPGSPNATLQDISSSIVANLLNVKSSVFKTSSIKTTSTTENNGSIASPISITPANDIMANNTSIQLGNQSHIATKVTSQDMVTIFQMSDASEEDMLLGKWTRNDIAGAVTTSSSPNAFTAPFGEEIDAADALDYAAPDDQIVVHKGANKSHYRSIAEVQTGSVGTQQNLPRTVFGYSVGDELTLVKSMAFTPDDNAVFVLDRDPVSKTVTVPMSRLGRIAPDSVYTSTAQVFSAYDQDNESGVTFGTLPVWGKTANNTEFKDYAVWFRARNWYVSGGAGSSGGSFLVRAKEYGLHGENITFKLEHPLTPNSALAISHVNTPDKTHVQLTFGSGAARTISLPTVSTFNVTLETAWTGVTNPPALRNDSAFSSSFFRYTFTASIALNSVLVGDVVGIGPTSGVTAANRGAFSIVAKGADYIIVYNPTGAAHSGESIASTSHFNIFPLANNTVAEIVAAINTSPIVISVANGSTSTVIAKATREDIYAVGSGYTASLGYGHDPVPANAAYSSINLYDSIAWVKTFENSDPHFTLKASLLLPGASTAYNMGTAPNSETSDLGEMFKLVPVTLWNIHHHFTQKAISQLPIVADVDISNAFRRIQIKSKLLGSAGAVEVIDSKANGAIYSVFGEAQEVVTGGGVKLLETKIAASPFSMNIGDYVTVDSSNPVQRQTALTINDTIDVAAIPGGEDVEYYFNHRIQFTAPTTVAITNVSSGARTGTASIWRWQFNTGDLSTIVPGDLLFAHGAMAGWTGGNYQLDSLVDGTNEGDGAVLGFPVVAVNATSKTVDIMNLKGAAMTATPLTSSDFVAIGPSPITKWNLAHEASNTHYRIEKIGFNDMYRLRWINESPVNPMPTPPTPPEPEVVWIDQDMHVVDGVRTGYINSSANDGTDFIVMGAFTYIDGISCTDIARWDGAVWSNMQLPSYASGYYTRMGGFVFNDAEGGLWCYTGNFFTKPITGESGVILKWNKATSQWDGVYNTDFIGTRWSWDSMTINGVASRGDYFYFASNKESVSRYNYKTNVTTKLWYESNFAAPNSGFISLCIDGSNLYIGGSPVHVGDTSLYVMDIGTETVPGSYGHIKFGPQMDTSSYVSQILMFNNELYIKGSFSFFDDGTHTLYNFLKWDGVDNWIRKETGFDHPTNFGHIVLFNGFLYTTVTTLGDRPAYRFNGDSWSAVVSDPANARLNAVTFVGSNNNALTFEATGSVIWLGSAVVIGGPEESVEVEPTPTPDPIYGTPTGPKFLIAGVGVDDLLVIGGDSFSAHNRGKFRILAVEDDRVVFQNINGVEELDYLRDFSSANTAVTWTSNSNIVTGNVGEFHNLAVGDWVKKIDDDNSLYAQVTGFRGPVGGVDSVVIYSANATQVTLGSNYRGITSVAPGVAINTTNAVNVGPMLRAVDDLTIYSGDSVQVGDALAIDSITDASWFKPQNAGVFSITQHGTHSDFRPFLRISNSTGISQSGVLISVDPKAMSIIEGSDKKTSMIKKITNVAVDAADGNLRVVHLSPPDMGYKISQANGSKLSSLGKLGFEVGTVNGIDGYQYYTGLMGKVQKTLDGYEPDALNFPGYRAVGGSIELLPPLIKRIQLAMQITTNLGVNISEIEQNIVSAVVQYINNLGVGQDVILSEITVQIMGVTGVAAVTFTTPAASQERIGVDDISKAYIETQDISIA